MPDNPPPRPPRGLGKAGGEFWRSTYAVYVLDAKDVPVLLEVCRCLDELAALSAVITEQGVMSTGAGGQMVANPALAQARASRVVLDKLLVRLGLPSSTGEVPLTGQQMRARKAAQVRWAGHIKRGAEAG